MTRSLLGKKVLFIAPSFFGYEKEIQDDLEQRGADVDFLLDRPFNSPFLKAVTRVWRGLIIRIADQYYRKAMAGFSEKKYDLIFVINGQTLSINTLQHWREKYPNARFVLYIWDSFRNRSSIVENLKFFDCCFSFDINDAAAFEINFRPLFFSAGFESRVDTDPSIDISFIGTTHTDRYSIVSAIRKGVAPTEKTYFYLFLQAKWVFWVYKIINSGFRHAKIEDFRFSPMSKSDVQEIFSKSRIILDIEHPDQTGLTIRTLETLGAKKKLITTNKNIDQYDFFSPANICIVDRQHPVISDDFLYGPYVDIPVDIYDRYKLINWMDEILEKSMV